MPIILRQLYIITTDISMMLPNVYFKAVRIGCCFHDLEKERKSLTTTAVTGKLNVQVYGMKCMLYYVCRDERYCDAMRSSVTC